jgi:hypothetical protein
MKLRERSFLLVTIVSLVAISYNYLVALHSHTKLVEDRGVYDDICYLRQAYLFRTQGVIGGLDTDYSSARYAISLIHKMGLMGKLTSNVPCHRYLEATNKFSMQYPPGTGFFLSMFPEGSQASGLYIASSTTIFLMLIWMIATARSQVAVGVLGVTGFLTLYLMVNPAKASYSIAPTMPICIALAYLTVKMFSEKSFITRIVLASTVGLLLGIATDIRLSSLLLASGFALTFAIQFIRERSWVAFLQPVALGISLVVGAIPTLIANTVNGGSPFKTAYGGADTEPPLTSLDPLTAQIHWYLFSGTHSVLTWLSLALLAAIVRVSMKTRQPSSLQLPILVALLTLTTNDAYFITHPIQSQYYSVPPAILALWVGSFALVFWPTRQEMAHTKSLFRTSAAVGAIALITAGALLAYDGMFSRPPFAPSVTIPPNAIIWVGGNNWKETWKVNGLGLAFQYRFQRPTIFGLGLLPIVDQNKIIAAASTDSRPQFIVADDQRMKELVARMTPMGTVSFAGQVFGANLYRVDRSPFQ